MSNVNGRKFHKGRKNDGEDISFAAEFFPMRTRVLTQNF